MSLPMRTPRRMGLAGLRVKVAIVSARAGVAAPRTVTTAAMQAMQHVIERRVNRAPFTPMTLVVIVLVTARNERERTQRRARPDADLERRHHQQKLVGARLGQFLQEIVLDDVDAVVGD